LNGTVEGEVTNASNVSWRDGNKRGKLARSTKKKKGGKIS